MLGARNFSVIRRACCSVMRTGVQISASIPGNPQLLGTPVPKDLMASSGPHTCVCTHKHAHMRIKYIYKKKVYSYIYKKEAFLLHQEHLVEPIRFIFQSNISVISSWVSYFAFIIFKFFLFPNGNQLSKLSM